MKKNCLSCKKEITVTQKMLDRGRGKFCSKKCKGMGWNLNGVNNPRWNGGKTIDSHGYLLVKAPIDHPYKTKHGYIREHRLIMEISLQRYLLPEEDIHHINHDKTDNRIENLMLFKNRREHLKHEHSVGLYENHLNILNNYA